MAEFKLSIEKTLRNEGGFADRRATTGEVVNRGVTLDTLWRLGMMPASLTRTHPASDVEVDVVRSLSLETTYEVYQSSYWRHLALDSVRYQLLADKVFDLDVNTGHGAVFLQRAVNDVHWPGVPELVVDGIVGQKTVAAVNASDGRLLLGHCGTGAGDGVGLRGVAERYYRSIADPDNTLAAWLDRLRRD